MSSKKPPAAGPLRYGPGAPPRADVETAARNGLQVRYCGGCNPFIDRVAVAQSVQAGLGDEPPTGGGPPRTLYVSGCPRACASDHRLSVEDDAAVVVAGEHVDAAPTAAAAIPSTVISKIASPTAPPHPVCRAGDEHGNDVAHTR